MSAVDIDQVKERLEQSLRSATGPRYDRSWRNVITDLAPEVMKLIEEARAPTPEPEPEPLTGGDADMGARVRVKPGVASHLQGATGTIVGRFHGSALRVRFGLAVYAIDREWLERAPAACPHCGARADR